MRNIKVKQKSDGIDRVLKTPIEVHHPEEKFRDLMSILLTRFPRIYADNLLYLHGRKWISMSMGGGGESEEEKREADAGGKAVRDVRGNWSERSRRVTKGRGRKVGRREEGDTAS